MFSRAALSAARIGSRTARASSVLRTRAYTTASQSTSSTGTRVVTGALALGAAGYIGYWQGKASVKGRVSDVGDKKEVVVEKRKDVKVEKVEEVAEIPAPPVEKEEVTEAVVVETESPQDVGTDKATENTVFTEKAAAPEPINLAGVKGADSERTFIAVKPDGVQRNLVGKIITRFEERGYKLVAIKSIVPSKELAEEHYENLSTRPFFKGLVDYMTNGKAPVIAMVWEGKDVIRQGRAMIGATNPLDAAPGSIRGQYCIAVGRNIIHGSDSYESAVKEIQLWFGKPGDIIEWTPANAIWTLTDN